MIHVFTTRRVAVAALLVACTTSGCVGEPQAERPGIDVPTVGERDQDHDRDVEHDEESLLTPTHEAVTNVSSPSSGALLPDGHAIVGNSNGEYESIAPDGTTVWHGMLPAVEPHDGQLRGLAWVPGRNTVVALVVRGHSDSVVTLYGVPDGLVREPGGTLAEDLPAGRSGALVASEDGLCPVLERAALECVAWRSHSLAGPVEPVEGPVVEGAGAVADGAPDAAVAGGRVWVAGADPELEDAVAVDAWDDTLVSVDGGGEVTWWSVER